MESKGTSGTKPSDSKASVFAEFKKLISSHSIALSKIKNLQFKHKYLTQLQKKNIDQVQSLLENLDKEFNSVKNDIVWDHLVVGFFGETNAGKSTIIETLRLKYSADKQSWKHGSIVGNGMRDYTKEAAEYDLNIHGRRVTLVDIPGIEGDEAKYAKIIRKALRKTHFVFYVHPKIKPADQMIALSIKNYLAEWTKVYSIWNINQNASYYRDEAARRQLITKDLEVQNRVIHESFESILGRELYIGNIPVQALLGLASCSDFPEDERLGRNASKLKGFFGDAEALYKFSNIENVVDVLLHNCDTFERIIIESQRQKVTALKKQSQRLLSELLKQQMDEFEQLADRLCALRMDVRRRFSNLKSKINKQAETIINRGFSKVQEAAESALESGDPTSTICNRIKNVIGSMPYKIQTEITNAVREATSGQKIWLHKRFSELSGIQLTVPDLYINSQISVNIDISYITESLDVTFDDALEVGGAAAGGASIGVFFGGPIGATIGAAIGAGVGAISKGVFGDGGRSKAKKKLNDELNVCKKETLGSLKDALRRADNEIDMATNRIQSILDKELENINILKNENEELYSSIRK